MCNSRDSGARGFAEYHAFKLASVTATLSAPCAAFRQGHGTIAGRGRSYLTTLGFTKGSTIVADRLEGEPSAWVILAGRVVTDVECAILLNPNNVASLKRAAAESIADDDPTPAQPRGHMTPFSVSRSGKIQ
jgi:hypothetical protein